MHGRTNIHFLNQPLTLQDTDRIDGFSDDFEDFLVRKYNKSESMILEVTKHFF